MGTGKNWTKHEKEELGEALLECSTYGQVQAQYFPERSVSGVAQAARRYWPDRGYKRKKDWTTKERKMLEQVLTFHDVSSWDDVARYLPGRSGQACKQFAYKNLTPPMGKRYFLQREEALIRKYGPPKPWVQVLAREYKKAFKASGKTKAALVQETGISRMTVDNLMAGRRAPRMPLYVELCLAVDLDPGAALSRALEATQEARERAASGGRAGVTHGQYINEKRNTKGRVREVERV